MNKKLFPLRLILFSCLISSCTVLGATQPASPLVNNDLVRDFNFVTLDAPGVMEISQGNIESLEIVGDPDVTSSIKTSVADRTLVISSEKKLPTNSSITYKLIVKNLTGVVLNDFGVVKIPTYGSDALELTVNGPGRMDLGNLKVNDLRLVLNGNGSFEADSIISNKLSVSSPDTGSISIASGNSVDLLLELGPGFFLGADFKSTNVTVNMNGSGTAQVWAVEKLDVAINGKGQVTYFGEPTMNMSISGGGQLTGGGNK